METIQGTESLSRRSFRRLRHEAHAKVFVDQFGGLEELRAKIGLRPSQICELLKVHPSAWTRWKKGKRPPPHVFQMLEWYLELLKWRGQNKDLPKMIEPIILAHEDPSIHTPITLENPKLSKDPLFRILVATWLIQILTWVVFALYLLKN